MSGTVFNHSRQSIFKAEKDKRRADIAIVDGAYKTDSGSSSANIKEAIVNTTYYHCIYVVH